MIKIGDNKLVKNTLKLTGGSVLNYIIPIVTTPILTRIYLPQDYGIWGIFSSLTTVLAVFVCGGYEYAIVEENIQCRKVLVVRTCTIIALIFNILVTVFFVIARLLNFDVLGLGNIVFFIPLYLFITGILSVFQNFANAKEGYKVLAFSQIVAGVSLALFRIILGVINTQNGLIYGAILSSILTLWYIIYMVMEKKDLIATLNRKEFITIINDYKNYPLYDAPSTFLIYLSNNIPILLLANYYDKALLGGYTMVLQLLLLPMSFIGSNMGRVFFQQASSNKKALATISLQVFKLSYILGFSVIFFFVFGGDYLLYFILGSDWGMAGEYALFLSLWSFITISFAPLKPIYRVLGKQKVQIKLMLWSFIIQTGSLVLLAIVSSNIGIVIMIYSIICSIFKLIEGTILLKFCNVIASIDKKIIYFSSCVIILFWLLRSIQILGGI